MSRLLILGATGLVGRAALERALGDARVAHVVAPTRRPLAPHPQLTNPVVDFAALPHDAPWWRVDAVLCAIGTTMRQARARDAFRRVDFTIPLEVARLARRHGATTFALVSSIGANPRARSFYLRTKGQLEAALQECGFTSLTVLRPSFIDGARDEPRPAEALGLAIFRALRPVIPRRLRPVRAEDIARALLDAAIDSPVGVSVEHF